MASAPSRILRWWPSSPCAAIVLNTCPTSNVVLGVFPGFDEHPLPQLRDAGVRLTLGSDDPPYFGATIGGEYQVCSERLGFSEDDLRTVTAHRDRRRLLRRGAEVRAARAGVRGARREDPRHRQRRAPGRGAGPRPARRTATTWWALDVLASPFTRVVGSIADRDVVRGAMAGVDAVLHAATLHKPHVGSHARRRLRRHQRHRHAQPAGGGGRRRASARFVFTSTTSAFGRALTPPPGAPAAWITEDVDAGPAQHLRRHQDRGRGPVRARPRATTACPCLILRTSRFFPEDDDRDDARAALRRRQPQGQRVALPARRHPGRRSTPTCSRWSARPRSASAATSSAPRRRSAPADLAELRRDAPAVVRAAVPRLRRRCTRAAAGRCSPRSTASTSTPAPATELGWPPRYDFRHALDRLAAGEDPRSPLARAVGAKGYHAEPTGVYTTRARDGGR